MGDKKKLAIYAGVFDPPNLAHLHILKTAAKLFPQIIWVLIDTPDAVFRQAIRTMAMGRILEHYKFLRNVTYCAAFDQKSFLGYYKKTKADSLILPADNGLLAKQELWLRDLNLNMTFLPFPNKKFPQNSTELIANQLKVNPQKKRYQLLRELVPTCTIPVLEIANH